MTETVLDRIKSYKLDEIKADKAAKPIALVEEAAKAALPPRGFYSSLRSASETGYGLIAEIKKASPSKGLIRKDFQPEVLAQAYQEGGATCLSVLTDKPSFQGAKEFLAEAKNATSLPVLRKDFMYDTYQVAEARAMGADCILIIMASVSDSQPQNLKSSIILGHGCTNEIHDHDELERACKLKSPMIGINNRNLKPLKHLWM